MLWGTRGTKLTVVVSVILGDTRVGTRVPLECSGIYPAKYTLAVFFDDNY